MRKMFTIAECGELAEWLENLNTPDNRGAPVRRLTDMFWALHNNGRECVVETVDE